MAPRIKNISADELQRLFRAPEIQKPGFTVSDAINLQNALELRRQNDLTQKQKVAEIERKIAEEQAKAQQASDIAKGLTKPQTQQLSTLQQTAAPIQPGEARPLFGPQAQAADTQKQQQIADLQQEIQSVTAAVKTSPEVGAKQILGGGQDELSGRDVQQFQLVSPTGERQLINFVETVGGGKGAMFDAISGAPISEEDRQNLSKQGFKLSRATPQLREDAAGNLIVVDPNIGQRNVEIGTGAAPIPLDKLGTVADLNDPLVPKTDRAQIIKELNDTKNDPIVRNALKLLPVADNVERFLKEDNKVALDRLGGLTQKIIATDSGNLAAWEQRDPNARAIIDRIKQWATMNTQGLLLNTTKEEMVNAMQIMRENVAENMNRVADITADNLIGLYPQLNRQAMLEKMGITKQATKLQQKRSITPESVQQLSDEELDAQIRALQGQQ